MRPIDFADKYLHPYRVKGEEIIPEYCPFCGGGDHGKDKHTFALSMSKETFVCLRGSCGQRGTFTQLCQHFGEESHRSRSGRGFELRRQTQKKSYRAPEQKPMDAGQRVEAYLSRRGFSPETWRRRGVGEYNGAIAFPYYENGELVLMKFRRPEKYSGKGPKAWREEGGKPVFWGMDDCNPDLPLVIVEGEMDALALDEAGVPNVVSVPSGAEDLTCVELCWEWLEQFSRVVIWPDNDEPGQEMARKLITKLGEGRCSVVKSPHKDANEHLYHEGKESTMQAVVQAEPVPMAGLIRLADAKPFDLDSAERVRSSIRAVNEIIGGYMMGQLSVWTGINASGKSTFLGQELLWAVDQGYNVCAFSGELPAALFRYWIDIQAAGPRYLRDYTDKVSGNIVRRPDPFIVGKIQDWYRDRFFLFDSFGDTQADQMLAVFAYAAMRYNCRVFLVDNLMTTIMGFGDSDYYRQQSEMVGRLKEFAHKYDAHVHLVAHPRKAEGRLTKMDIAGSGDITNRADNVFALHRVHPAHKEQQGCDSILDLFKSRFTGYQDDEIKLFFDYPSKRFCMVSDRETLSKSLGWAAEIESARITA